VPGRGPLAGNQPSPSYTAGHFDHQRLDAFAIARDVLCRGEALCHAVPPGHDPLVEPLRRSLVAAYLGVVDAASRRGADRIFALQAARSHAAQAAAALEALVLLGCATEANVAEPTALLSRLCAMLIRLGDRAAHLR